MSCSISLFFLLSNFFIFSSSFVNTTHTCSVQQTLDLLLFKQNLNSINFSIDDTYYSPCEDWLGSGYNPIMMNWNTDTDCCNWNGVTCDHLTGDVIGLDLSCGMLHGTIHNNSTLFHLPNLQRLNLAFNDFTGPQLPTNIGKFFNSLTHLNISFCGFIGHVPKDISQLHKLVSLDLSLYNDFNLEPRVFNNLLQNLTVMEELSLRFVNIYSSFPTNLNLSSTLRLLDLSYTGLQGKLPRYIFSLQYLEKLDLSGNNFTGNIPSDISFLTKLAFIDVSYNTNLQIQPRIFSIFLQNSTFLSYLRFSQVHIGWVLPVYLNISSSIRSIGLSNSNLQGKLPDNILNFECLEDLDLSRNENLSGPFPKIYTTTSHPLMFLDLSSISLSGEIPTSIGHLKSLVYLVLSDCGLNGSLPKSLVNLKYLKNLVLSSNMLSGTLPLELFSLRSLKVLSLDNNQLTGQIDLQTLQRLTNLSYLDLSSNHFKGDWELDTLLSSLTNLISLDISYSGLSVSTRNVNHFVNPDFEALRLASCNLKVFPSFIRAMTNLLTLDLSNNDIHGHIPDWVEEIGGYHLLLLDLSNNSITGTIPDVYEGWVNLFGFNLNGNHLEGKVPISLHNCKNLKVIDLGKNHLNDTFPSRFEDLPNLKVLVLRSNDFHGGIKASSKIKFPFPKLRVLDLSHNGFLGQLPTKYFKNFNAMKNVVTNNIKQDYMYLGYNTYYSINFVVKGVDLFFSRVFVGFTIIDLSNNKFEGVIPNVIGNLNSLKALNLSLNNLTGRIPQALGKISEIESLDLSWNKLTGEIPQSLSNLTSLEFLNLSQNHLVGRIPQGKQFNTFEVASFGGNPKLCGLPLPKKCNEPSQQPQPEGDEVGDDDESGFTWKAVVIGFVCGTLLGIVLGYFMLLAGKPKWFNSIADAIEHLILKWEKKRGY